ncbi:MAG: hypothetical protein AAGM22_32340 [Acidobacteriota bacterium]
MEATATPFRMAGIAGIKEYLKIPAPELGLNMLLGRNGASKSNAIHAVTVYWSGESGKSTGLVANDETGSGWISGPGGGTVTVKASVTRKGEVVGIELGDHGLLADLIRPKGLVKPEAKDNRRAQILAQLSDLEVTQDLLSKLAGGDPVLSRLIPARGDDILKAARDLKRAIGKDALNHEARATQAAAEAATAKAQIERVRKEQLEGVPRPTETDSDALQAAASAAAGAAATLRAQVDARRAAEGERDRIRAEGLGQEPPIAEARTELERASARVDELKRELEVAEQDLGNARVRVEALAQPHADWVSRQRILAQPIEGPSEDELAGAVAEEERAMAAIATATAYGLLDELESARKRAEERRAEEAREAERYRTVEDQVFERLRSVLSSYDWGNIIVGDDGQVCYLDKETGESQNFERLSDGQKVRAAITEVGLRVYSGGYMPLAPSLWTDLDPYARLELVEVALKEEVSLLSEAPWINNGIAMQVLGREWCDRMRSWLERQDPESALSVVGLEDLVGTGIAVPGGVS